MLLTTDHRLMTHFPLRYNSSTFHVRWCDDATEGRVLPTSERITALENGAAMQIIGICSAQMAWTSPKAFFRSARSSVRICAFMSASIRASQSVDGDGCCGNHWC